MARTESLVAGLVLLTALTAAAVVAALIREPARREPLVTLLRRSERGHPRWELLAQ